MTMLSLEEVTQKYLGLKLMNWYLCTLTPAAKLKSWLRWHLPPILCVLPHKQIKELYIFLSPLHFTPMTLHLHLSFVSLLLATPLSDKQAVIYMQILVRKRRRNAFLLLKNKHSLTILQASLFSLWLDMAFRETQACCLQSWV